jgi:hypothetical protein
MSDWKLLNTSTTSDASSVEFTDLTGYKIFKFVFVDVNPATDGAEFTFQVNASGGSGYNETITSTFFVAGHDEADSSFLTYVTSADQAQGTAYQWLAYDVGNGADESAAGELYLFNPTSTTYVKHFYSRINFHQNNNTSTDGYAAGYINTTTNLSEIDFKMSTGNFDGTIKQYGLVAT